jgi:hypothetical protein
MKMNAMIPIPIAANPPTVPPTAGPTTLDLCWVPEADDDDDDEDGELERDDDDAPETTVVEVSVLVGFTATVEYITTVVPLCSCVDTADVVG